jgi:hypothetical protein
MADSTALAIASDVALPISTLMADKALLDIPVVGNACFLLEK